MAGAVLAYHIQNLFGFPVVAKAGYALMFGDVRVGRVAGLGLVVLAGITAALAFG